MVVCLGAFDVVVYEFACIYFIIVLLASILILLLLGVVLGIVSWLGWVYV